MKRKLHLNYSVSSSFAFIEKENTIDCKEDPRKKSKYLEKKGEIIKKGTVLQTILEINGTFKSNEHLSLLPCPGVVIPAYTFDSTTPEEGQEKKRVPLSFSVPWSLVSAIPTSYIMSNVKPLVDDLMRD